MHHGTGVGLVGACVAGTATVPSLRAASAPRAPAMHPLALPVFPLPSPAILGPHHQTPGDVAEGEAQ